MAALDENALICDFAESYRIYDWRRLPARFAATLAAGLSPSSRIMRKLSGAPAPLEQLLLAIIADSCRLLIWQRSQAAMNGRPAPPSIYDMLFGHKAEKNTSPGFDSPEAFETWRAKMTRRDADG